jgi:hypothetical protein
MLPQLCSHDRRGKHRHAGILRGSPPERPNCARTACELCAVYVVNRVARTQDEGVLLAGRHAT